jgi:hypothetical protein
VDQDLVRLGSGFLSKDYSVFCGRAKCS